MSVPTRMPAKLNSQFNCQGLWNFEGNYNDLSGVAPAADLTESGAGAVFTNSRDYTDRQCVMAQDQNRSLRSATPGLSKLLILGDVTAQAVVFFSQFGFDTNGINIFSFDGPTGGSSAENAAWKLSIRNTANRMTPSFAWEQGSESNVFIEDATFTLDIGRWYHIVGVRDGTDARLYVNNLLVASANSVTLPTDASNAVAIIGEDATGTQGFLKGAVLSSAKVSNRALTDGEIAQEYNRVRGF